MDNKFIEKCFKLATRGHGNVSPNPLVGAIIVKDGKIIGEGWHKKFGDVHAEVNAIKNSSASLKNSTLYCNLEPCVHKNKKTPPCVPVIIKSGITRVVISNIDPNINVNGKGITELRKSGIKVVVGVDEETGYKLNRFFFKYIKNKIPYVTLKIAQSSDGKITDSIGNQTQISEKKSGKFVHKQRSIYDAVLVGAESIKTDNPLLTVRSVKGRNPVRIILDGNLSVPLNSRIFKLDEPEKTWIIKSNKSNRSKAHKFINKGIKVLEFPSDKRNKISIKKILQRLGELNISSVFVEGGQQVFSQFIQSNLFDEIILLQSAQLFGRGLSSVSLKKSLRLKINSVEILDDDIKIVLRKEKH